MESTPTSKVVWYKGYHLRYKFRLKDFRGGFEEAWHSLTDLANFWLGIKGLRQPNYAWILDSSFHFALMRYQNPTTVSQSQFTLFHNVLTKSSLAQSLDYPAKSARKKDLFLLVTSFVLALEAAKLEILEEQDCCCLSSRSATRVYNILTHVLQGFPGSQDFLRNFQLVSCTKMAQVYFSPQLVDLRELLDCLKEPRSPNLSVSFFHQAPEQGHIQGQAEELRSTSGLSLESDMSD